MIKIGITGGIGSGKSVISHLLQIMGIPVYISDIEAKRLTVSDPQIRNQLTALLGEDVYLNDELNKPLLANYLFSNPVHAQTINSIIHPRVKEDFRTWVTKHTDVPIVAMESAILIEAGFAGEVDKLIMIYAPLDLRVKRSIKRDSATSEAILKRIANQMSDEEKKLWADYIILNDERTSIIPQLLNILKILHES